MCRNLQSLNCLSNFPPNKFIENENKPWVNYYVFDEKNKQVLEQLDIDKVLYHSLWMPTRDYKVWQEETLKSILKTGYIATRNDLRRLISNKSYDDIILNKRINTNYNDAVSLAKKNKSSNLYNNAYWFYVDNNPSIIIDPIILEQEPWLGPNQNGNRKLMDGEYQILNSISLKYMLGISLPNVLTEKMVKKLIEKDDKDNVIIWNLKHMSYREFINYYFYAPLLYEQLLHDYSKDNYIFDSVTGYPIKSCEEEIEKILKLCKKI